MEPKKISFGFTKISKKLSLLPTKGNANTETKVEMIKCLEGQEIKLVDEKPEKVLLAIPLKESQRTSTALASLLKRRAVLLGKDETEAAEGSSIETTKSQNNGEIENIEKRAARELLAGIHKSASDQRCSLVLPVVKPDELPLEGATESTLEDYEYIPVQDFGKAMLRGMGWTDPFPKANKNKGLIDDTPMVRPKGMGLGADKFLSKKPLLVAPEANEILEIKRNAFVRVLGGKYKDLYGQIEGFDDHAGRVIVKLAIGGTKEAFNEFLCQPVSRKEYAQYAKCINSTKYDEYKKKEKEYQQIILNKDDKDLMLKTDKKYSTVEKYKIDKNISRYDCSKEKKGVKIEKDVREKEERRKCVDYEYETKNRCKEEDTCRNANRAWVEDDVKAHASRSQRQDNNKNEKYYRRDDMNDTKFRKNNKETHRYSRGSEMCRSHHKVVISSDSEREASSSKHKKSKKYNSKKSTKSKSKFRDTSSDSETTPYSMEPSSDSEQERIKHKKKRNRKRHERSRSRGRK